MNTLARLFHAKARRASHHCQTPGGNRAELVLERLESRIVPGAFENAFVVPVSQPTDGIHVHTLEAALARITSGGAVTIEPGASPDAGQVTIGNAGFTIQGEPNVPASSLPSENILFTGMNGTLTNLNLGQLQLGVVPGDTLISGNHVSRCVIQDLVENGVQSTFTQNTITGSAIFEGNSPVSTNGDLVANNIISGSASIRNCDGITVTQNTLDAGDNSGISLVDSGEPGSPITIANNHITIGSNHAGISIEQDTGTTNVAILNNTITSNGGVGLVLGCSTGSKMFALVQGNGFYGGRTGIFIAGDGTSAGNVDLGGGSFTGMGSSRGGNDVRGFTKQGTIDSAAIVLIQTAPDAVIPALDNIFQAGVLLDAVVDSATQGDRNGTGQINAGALDSPNAFVQTLYNEVLGRTGTSSELDTWVSVLDMQGQATVVNDILHSSEALGRIVDSFYLRFLGRAADPGGRAGWIGFLQNGGTEEEIESLFLTSPEYLSHINVDFVQSLYLNILGRPGSPGEVAAWNNNIQNVGGIMGVANAFTHSSENRLNTLRSDFQTFLHRTPADAELMPLVNTSMDLLALEGLLLSSPEFFANG
jgi:hypothetical protein